VKTDKTTERMNAIVAPIIEAIENGIANPADWTAPWHRVDAAAFAAFNPVTGRSYTGGNRFVLAVETMVNGAESHWGTYRHWASLSKHTKACEVAATNVGKRNESRPECGDDCKIVNVVRGAKATWLFRPRKFKKIDETTGLEKYVIAGFSPFPVFHSGVVEGYEIPVDHTLPTTPTTEVEDVAAAFEFGASVGAEIFEDPTSGASYSPSGDHITMPARDRWITGHGCWATMAHELTHWTGHKSRLDRELSTRFGGDAYAAEELIAELGSAFTLARLGRSSEPREDHAHYLASWLRVLKEDPKRLWTAAGMAEKASEHIMSLVPSELAVAA
jgi:antirestriction protein ArdC